MGDALGIATEGMTVGEIRRVFGEVREFKRRANFIPALSKLEPGQWTDDTQMTVALAEAILEAGGFDPEVVAKRFARWVTEGPRYPGYTCVTACRRLAEGVPWDRAGDPNGAGCGSAMRAAPIGLLHPDDPEAVYRDSSLQSVITHKDPRAVAGSVAVAYAVSRLVHGGRVEPGEFASEVAEFVRPISPEMAERIEEVAELVSLEPEEALTVTGTGGFVLEVVPAAFYCFLSSPEDFEHAVVTAANAGGDTDSIGAIAGAFSGAYNGASAIPRRFLEGLEGREKLVELADRLFEIAVGEG